MSTPPVRGARRTMVPSIVPAWEADRAAALAELLVLAVAQVGVLTSPPDLHSVGKEYRRGRFRT